METSTQNPLPMEGSGSNAQPTSNAGVQPANGKPASTPEQREIWRKKWQERKNRKSTPKAGGETPAPSAPAGNTQAPSGNLAPVPWDSSTIQPLIEELIKTAEKSDVDSLVEKAKKIDSKLAAQVETDAAWPQMAKVTLNKELPKEVAELLNSLGIGAHNAGKVAIVGAIASIITSRSMLSSKLDSIVKELKAAQQEKANATT